jgi:hypothetical protein
VLSFQNYYFHFATSKFGRGEAKYQLSLPDHSSVAWVWNTKKNKYQASNRVWSKFRKWNISSECSTPGMSNIKSYIKIVKKIVYFLINYCGAVSRTWRSCCSRFAKLCISIYYYFDLHKCIWVLTFWWIKTFN